MADWRQSLAGVDEDYLVGISNKGIVKRAYKDLEAEGGRARAAAAPDWNAQELAVEAGGENVTIRLPLGESRCSCPSRSICRHVIMAILLARQAALDGEADAGQSGTDENHMADSAGDSGGASDGLGQKVWQEILAQPRRPLIKALGSRGLRRLAAAMEAGQVPPVERGTVVRMQLPGEAMAVKLLSPLEYSTCSCHRKELCAHKAEAILWCQYLEKQLSAAELARELEQQPSFDLQQLREAAEQIKTCLEHLLETGLARSGEEQAQELERLAILCHNAGLPGWEGNLRALAEGYGKYLRRSAGQTMERLAGQLQQMYEKTIQLRELADQSPEPVSETSSAQSPSLSGNVITRIQALAGEFRSEYRPVGDLELTGITMEHFVTDSGYEGDTVYFLEAATGTWYTYTNARPTFYEGKKRSGYRERASAPWGVPLSLEELANVRLRLRGAKCDSGGRLSSSQETQGEILGKSELTADKLEGWYYREYDRLMREQIPEPGRHSGDVSAHPCLVFVQADGFEQGRFNEITQNLELPIWDRKGRKILVELPYSKREEASIRYLERLKQKQQPCFLGRVYLRESRICLYPVDLLERAELEDGEARGGSEDGEARGGEGQLRSGDGAEETDRTDAVPVPDAETCRALQSYLDELSWLLQEIYQVGSATVSDNTLESLQQAQKQGESYGMTTLSQWLGQLGEQLSLARHRMRLDLSETMGRYCRLWQYVQLCRQKAVYDLASAIYR